jgi:ankyrin repeat protein
MVMFAKDFAAGERSFIRYKGTGFRLLDENIYNYAPDVVKTESGAEVINITDNDLITKYLFHMRGGRKLFMKSLAGLLGYQKT